MLTTPFEPTVLENADTAHLKSSLIEHVRNKDTDAMSAKVKFAKTLMPLFNELAKRNPTPDLSQQIPLLKGIWLPIWSTIPFQDIIPGRIHQESYQIFNDNGYYANLARYKPGQKQKLLSWFSRWLLSYDFMILQRYAVQTRTHEESDHMLKLDPSNQDYWEIQNVAIQQSLHIGSRSFSASDAQDWFNKSVAEQNKPNLRKTTRKNNRVSEKQSQQIAKAKPRLDHLYIDSEFRLVKTQREKNQRPSYTVALRLS